jgi:hypothetical protein
MNVVTLYTGALLCTIFAVIAGSREFLAAGVTLAWIGAAVRTDRRPNHD